MSFLVEEPTNKILLKKLQYKTPLNFINIKSIDQPKISIGSNSKSTSCFILEKYVKYAEEIQHFDVFEDDTWIISYPKCGTTWTQEMVWLICNQLNYDEAKSIPLTKRFPFFEQTSVSPFDEDNENTMSTMEFIKNLTRPRFIKSHLPAGLLPKQLWTKKPKIIYITRNPKDVVISFYHHSCNLAGFTGTLEDFYELFLADMVIYAPFHSHLIDFWQMRHQENILFNTYEEMKMDLPSIIRKTSEFLGKPINNTDQIDRLCKHLSFDSMRTNQSVNMITGEQMVQDNTGTHPDDGSTIEQQDKNTYNFFRKGKIGTFKNEMSTEWIKKYDQWSAEQLKDCDFQFIDMD